MKFTINTIIAVAFAANVSALGINCRGSSNCAAVTCDAHDLQDQIDLMDDAASFAPGQHIACCGDQICAFTQSTTTNITGADAKALIAAVINHGCNKCGSEPFADNNVDGGQLTVNFVAQ
jgi:hypothetical protein